MTPSAKVSRRGMLGGGAAAAAMFAGAGAAGAAVPAAKRHGNRASGTRLITLGTAGGPTYMPGGELEGISSAVSVGDRFYLVDAGSGVLRQIRRAKLGNWRSPSAGPLDQLRAVFLTHLHSDHTTDLSALLSSGLFNGLQHADLPVKLIGPGNRGKLPPLFGPAPAPPIVAPGNPTPGTREMWDLLVQAMATDYNDRARDNRTLVPAQLIEARDVELPAWAIADPNNNHCPDMEPVDVYEDDRVKVTAILVQHAPVFPALAYRFDTDDGAVVFSGDTGPTDNLVTLAQGADVLVHEVISAEWVDQEFPHPRTPVQEAGIQHLLGAHTEAGTVGSIAERAGVGTLVLNHFVPQTWPAHKWKKAARLGFRGQVLVGEDLMEVYVGGGAK